MTAGRKVTIDATGRQNIRQVVDAQIAAAPGVVAVAKPGQNDRAALERLIGQLEDPKHVRESFKIPSGHTREFSRGYVEGAQMNAQATAKVLREILCCKPSAREE